MNATEHLGTATYSPEDNKLRFYPFARLSKEDYATIRGAGFIWAPKQELFVAPTWSPGREDFLEAWCGDIDDEDKSLVGRAEERADRFDDYSDKRKADADSAHKMVENICEHIPLGQPILVGHHSERHARKDAERIENGMRKAVKMWETSKYWERRAAGAIRHAKYKERPDVRARRIKGIEADKRKQERERADAEQGLKFWQGEMTVTRHSTGEKFKVEITEANREQLHQLLGGVLGNTVGRFNVITREGGASWEGWSPWNVLEKDETRYKACPALPVSQCQERALKVFPSRIAYCNRWIAHYENRIAYERAMLAEGGGLEADKFNICTGGRILLNRRGGEWYVVQKVNCREGKAVSVSVFGYFRTIQVEEIIDFKPPQEGDFEKVRAASKLPPLCNYEGAAIVSRLRASEGRPLDTVRITQAEWDSQHADYKGTRVVDATDTIGRHRVRVGIFGPDSVKFTYPPVFITDAKTKTPPKPDGQAPIRFAREKAIPAAEPIPEQSQPAPKPEPEGAKFELMAQTLKQGVQVVSAPQLFPTPADIAAQLVELAGIESGQRILEPSAGTGNLIRAAFDVLQDNLSTLVAVEINPLLAKRLGMMFPKSEIRQADFMTCNGNLGLFDRVIMNPPFQNGDDIKHVKHALHFLKPGGRLVGICANGPRQNEALKPLAMENGGDWIELPEGSFKEQGTNVRTAMFSINAKDTLAA